MMSQRYQTINALKKITSFQNFVENLDACGFTIAGINSENVFTLCDQFADNIVWHTGNPDTDPWEWRIRVLEERNDIAYAKLFFKKGGYILSETIMRNLWQSDALTAVYMQHMPKDCWMPMPSVCVKQLLTLVPSQFMS